MQAIREKKCQKRYRAKVTGKMPHKEGLLVDYLKKDNYRTNPSSEGKECSLEYKVVKEEGAYSFLEIKLLTGRYHQIRAQLQLAKCPIVGDQKYGSKESLPYGAIDLEHFYFSFPHPVTEEIIEIEVV
jgi:23S rRNA pseudouridine1911/1915/1917 synthase